MNFSWFLKGRILKQIASIPNFLNVVWSKAVEENPHGIFGAHFQHQKKNLEDLEEIPLQLRENLWCMHRGAPGHFSINIRDYLDTVYPNHWLVRRDTEQCPARATDLNPLDFCISGFPYDLKL